MAVELAQAYVSITPSARGIGRTLSRELTGPLTSAGATAGDGAASSFGRRFVPAMARVGKTAGIALAGGLTAAGLFGIKIAADFEQTRIAFSGILGDVDKANALLQDLRDFAAKTPFEFTGLAESARALLAVGFTSEEIIPTMETLGNVAATLGVGEPEIKGVVRALGQMRGKGKASAEELQQISEQVPGFSAIKEIAEELGITTAEAFEQMAKGAIPADVAIEAILKGMADFPGAAGAMDRQSQTLNGVMSTLKDTISGIAIDFITPYLPAISSAVQAFTDQLTRFFEGFKTGFTEGATGAEAFGGRVHDALVVVRDFIRDEFVPRVRAIISEGFAAVKSWWDDNGETVMQTVVDIFSGMSTVINDVVTIIRDELIPRFTDFSEWLLGPGGEVELAIYGIAAALTAYAIAATIAAAATLLPLLPIFLAVAATGALILVTDRLIDRYSVGLSEAVQVVVDVFGGFLNILRDVKEFLEDVIGAAKTAIEIIARMPTPTGGGVAPFGLPGFDSGGVMPGLRGVHYPAMVAGGETILPTHKTPLNELIGAGSGGPLVGQLTINAAPSEDPGQATLRGLRKIRMMTAA